MDEMDCDISGDAGVEADDDLLSESELSDVDVRLFPSLAEISAVFEPSKKDRSLRKKPAPVLNRSLFSQQPLKINEDVLQFKDFAEERRDLLISLETLYKKTGSAPIWLIEHQGCFTNTAMRMTLTKILGGKRNFRKFVLTYTIDPTVFEYPIPPDDKIVILGGSMNNTYDNFGHDFTNNFSLPLLSTALRTNRIRVLGLCFGYQSLIEAYGRMAGVPVRTIVDTLQFGIYFVDFLKSHPAFSILATETAKGAAFTRSGYPRTEDSRPSSEIPGLNVTAQFTGQLSFSKSKKDKSFIPPGVSYLKHPDFGEDMVVSFQGHPEIQSSKTHLRPIVDYIKTVRNEATRIIQPEYELELPKRSSPRMIADAFFTPLLKHFAEELTRS
jgi:hypothetical protein